MFNRRNTILPEFWYRLYPELRHFKSREELREAKRMFRKRAFRGSRSWITVLGMAGVAAGLGVFIIRWLQSQGLGIWTVIILNALFWALVGAVFSLFLWHRPYIRFVRQYLQERGIAVCLKCGYDLRGQVEPRCPECGTAFEPELLRGTGDRHDGASRELPVTAGNRQAD